MGKLAAHQGHARVRSIQQVHHKRIDSSGTEDAGTRLRTEIGAIDFPQQKYMGDIRASDSSRSSQRAGRASLQRKLTSAVHRARQRDGVTGTTAAPARNGRVAAGTATRVPPQLQHRGGD